MLQLLARVAQRFGQPLLAHRLQQVVESVHLERLHRVAVVGGDEDGERHLLLQRGHHAEAIDLRHLNVEEYQIGLLALDHGDSGFSVAAFGHNLQVGFVVQQPAQALARQGFIVAKQHSYGHRGY